jgi:hypothetical protein
MGEQAGCLLIRLPSLLDSRLKNAGMTKRNKNPGKSIVYLLLVFSGK